MAAENEENKDSSYGHKIFNKDLIEFAGTTDFINSSTMRKIGEIQHNLKKPIYKDNQTILAALMRLLVFESTQLLSSPLDKPS